MSQLKTLTVKGFKSIRHLENFPLEKLTVLIGANGAGKSNFVEIFKLLREIGKGRLDAYTKINGGAPSFLFNGPTHTPFILMQFEYDTAALNNQYEIKLEVTVDEKFFLTVSGQSSLKKDINIDVDNSILHSTILHQIQMANQWIVYHFHDTGAFAPMRRSDIIENNKELQPDAGNIAPYLLMLKNNHTDSYQTIVQTIRLVAPFFDDFILDIEKNPDNGAQTVKLMWKQKGSDYPMQPYHFSDGTLRFICLVTALLQPSLPSTILIDEPELGLHPYAIEIFAELVQAATQKTQVILSTQSPTLVDYFTPNDIVVVDREQGGSTFHRLLENLKPLSIAYSADNTKTKIMA